VFVPVVNVIHVAVQYVADASVLSAFIYISPVGVHVMENILRITLLGVHVTVGVKLQA